MSLLSEHTWEHHRDRALENLEMATVVLKDESMPREERAGELHRLLRRLSGHQAALEIAAEAESRE